MTGGLAGRLYRGETDIDFVGRARVWFAISGAVILIGLLSLTTRGLNLGIDFEGGTSWELPAGQLDVAEARSVVEGAGVADADVQTLTDDDGRRIRVQAERGETVLTQEVATALSAAAGVEADAVDVQDVSPSWGDEITSKALRALLVFLVVVSIFITIRFELKMALATLAALVHDLLVVIGVYSVFGFPVTPATVIAILTILGYSIYDGIVVFDRVDENAKVLVGNSRITYAGMVNASLNQVLMRTLNTSITALIPVLSLLVVGSVILGAGTLQEFALALFVGQLSGAYSSIFIASPLLALLKEREPKLAALKQRHGGSTASGASGTRARGLSGSHGDGFDEVGPDELEVDELEIDEVERDRETDGVDLGAAPEGGGERRHGDDAVSAGERAASVSSVSAGRGQGRRPPTGTGGRIEARPRKRSKRR